MGAPSLRVSFAADVVREGEAVPSSASAIRSSRRDEAPRPARSGRCRLSPLVRAEDGPLSRSRPLTSVGAARHLCLVEGSGGHPRDPRCLEITSTLLTSAICCGIRDNERDDQSNQYCDLYEAVAAIDILVKTKYNCF